LRPAPPRDGCLTHQRDAAREKACPSAHHRPRFAISSLASVPAPTCAPVSGARVSEARD